MAGGDHAAGDGIETAIAGPMGSKGTHMRRSECRVCGGRWL